jgi:PhnB protein
MAVNYMPEGYGSVTPYLTVKNVEKLITFIKTAFDGKELFRMNGPDGRVAHAEMQIGTSRVMMGESPEGRVMNAMLCLYVPDCDAVYQKALAAGATSTREMADQFYGDRTGGVKDMTGNEWFISTHIEDVSEEEMEKRMASAAKH